jgi:hypothetical protein
MCSAPVVGQLSRQGSNISLNSIGGGLAACNGAGFTPVPSVMAPPPHMSQGGVSTDYLSTVSDAEIQLNDYIGRCLDSGMDEGQLDRLINSSVRAAEQQSAESAGKATAGLQAVRAEAAAIHAEKITQVTNPPDAALGRLAELDGTVAMSLPDRSAQDTGPQLDIKNLQANARLGFLTQNSGLTKIEVNGDGYCGLRAVAIAAMVEAQHDAGVAAHLNSQLSEAGQQLLNAAMQDPKMGLNQYGKFAPSVESLLQNFAKTALNKTSVNDLDQDDLSTLFEALTGKKPNLLLAGNPEPTEVKGEAKYSHIAFSHSPHGLAVGHWDVLV